MKPVLRFWVPMADRPTPPTSPALSAGQLAALAALGEERTAEVGDTLFRVGDRTYPFVAIVEGVHLHDAPYDPAARDELVLWALRHFAGDAAG